MATYFTNDDDFNDETCSYSSNATYPLSQWIVETFDSALNDEEKRQPVAEESIRRSISPNIFQFKDNKERERALLYKQRC